jgi:hypothetical protein
MARLECSRDYIGAVHHPDTGELVQLSEDHPRELAELVAAAHDHVSLADAETEDVSPDANDDAPTEADDAEAETFRCGVNDCSRKVDSATATCWQH